MMRLLRIETFHAHNGYVSVDVFPSLLSVTAWNADTDRMVHNRYLDYCTYCAARICADRVGIIANIPDDCKCAEY